MSKRRLPPSEPHGRQRIGPKVNFYTIGDWCPAPDATPEAVAIAVNIQFTDDVAGDVVLRLKTPQAVDTMIQGLLRYKRCVWPDSP